MKPKRPESEARIALKRAIRRGDPEQTLHLGFNAQVTLDDDDLSPDLFPIDPAWGWPSMAQSFALLIDGYAMEDECGQPRVHDLVERAESNRQSVRELDLTDARVLLFGLQRKYRDAWDEPDPGLVAAVLERIQDRVRART